jgi:hypothetical protein
LKARVFVTNLIRIEERNRWMKQREDLSRESRLARAVCASDEDCLARDHDHVDRTADRFETQLRSRFGVELRGSGACRGLERRSTVEPDTWNDRCLGRSQQGSAE